MVNMLKILDVCPACGTPRERQISKEKCLIALSSKGSALIIEYTKGGYIENEYINNSDWASEIINVDELKKMKERLVIWEGSCIERNDEHITFNGDFRVLTEEEWQRLKEGLLCL